MKLNKNSDGYSLNMSHSEILVLYHWISNFNEEFGESYSPNIKNNSHKIFSNEAEFYIAQDFEEACMATLAEPFSEKYDEFLQKAQNEINQKFKYYFSKW